MPKVSGEPSSVQLVRDGGDPLALEFRSDSSARHARDQRGKVTVEVSSDVLFAFDRAKLGARADTQLDYVARRIKSETDGPVAITGYTDSKGSKSYNKELSKRRAEAVKGAVGERLAGTRITLTVAGKGEANPVAPNRRNGHDNPAGRKRNRRVEISYTRTVTRHTSPPPTSGAAEPSPDATTLGEPVTGGVPYTKGLRIQVTDLRRLSHGVLARFAVHNTSSKSVDLDQWARTPDDYAGGYADHYYGSEAYWVNLVDSSRTKYWVVADTESHCVCSFGLGDLGPGETKSAWAVVSPPPVGTAAVDVHFSGYGTVKNVPISG
ncbi:MAG: OmpA family protein [Streptosporangiaceae bacterium]